MTEARGIINNYNITISIYNNNNNTCDMGPVVTNSVPANSDNDNYTITSGLLVPSLMYCLTIRASNSIGTGPLSNPVIINGECCTNSHYT